MNAATATAAKKTPWYANEKPGTVITGTKRINGVLHRYSAVVGHGGKLIQKVYTAI